MARNHPQRKVLGDKTIYQTAAAVGDITAWTAYSTNTEEIEAVAKRLTGTHGIIFDKKTGGSGNPVTAGIYRTLLNIDDLHRFDPEDRIALVLWVSAKTDIASVSLVLGTSDSHKMTWTWADTSITDATFNVLTSNIGAGVVTGNGWNPKDIDYMAVYATFDAHGDTLANGMILDSVYVQPNVLTKT